MKRDPKHGATEEIPWKIPEIEVISMSTKDLILKSIKPGQKVYPALISKTLKITQNGINHHLKNLVEEGIFEDLGFMRIKSQRGSGTVHLYLRKK